MSKPQLDEKFLEKDEISEESSLKGTLVSVLLLGGFIFVTWLGVWMLYLSR